MKYLYKHLGGNMDFELNKGNALEIFTSKIRGANPSRGK